jgi:hypothetical protein
MQELHEPSISRALSKSSKAIGSSQETTPLVENKPESLDTMMVHSDWCTTFMIYLRIGGLPDDKDEYEQLWWQARHYTLVNNELFRRSANDTLM